MTIQHPVGIEVCTSGGDDAVRALRDALRVSPDNIPLRQHLAATLLGLGRLADEKKGTLTVVGILAAAVVLVVTGFVVESSQVIVAAVNTALLAIPASAIFRGCSGGWPRRTMVALTVVIGAIGRVPLIDFLTHADPRATGRSRHAKAGRRIYSSSP